MIELLKKKTTELSDKEIESIYDLFEEVFHKRRTVEEFKEQFLNTSLGYSFHAVAMEDGKVVGHNVYVPFRYLKNDKPFLLCLSVDAMIHPDARGKGLYRKMLLACEEMAREEGCKLRVGFPNDNSYPVQVKGFKYHDIGKLDTYCLPIKVSAFASKLKPVDFLSKFFSSQLIRFSKLSNSDKKHSYQFHKDRKDFDNFRYKWFGGEYQFIETDGMKAVYRVSDFKGIPAAFLIDVYPLTKENFDKATRLMYKEVKNVVPFILFVGKLPFSPLSMVKIPAFAEPKQFHFVGKILDREFFDDSVLDISKWELNLSNYDLI